MTGTSIWWVQRDRHAGEVDGDIWRVDRDRHARVRGRQRHIEGGQRQACRRMDSDRYVL